MFPGAALHRYKFDLGDTNVWMMDSINIWMLGMFGNVYCCKGMLQSSDIN